MSARTVRMLAVLGVLLVLGGVYAGYELGYRRPAAALRERAAQIRSSIDRFADATASLSDRKARRAAIVAGTLGGDPLVVESRLRRLLSEMGDLAELRDVRVTHGRPEAQANPAAERGSKVDSTIRKGIEERASFSVIKAKLRGAGSLEAIASAVAAAESQPWLHRVDGVSIRPVGRDRASYEVTLDVTTMFVLGAAPEDDREPQVAATDPARLAALRSLWAVNPFVAPAPVAVVEATPVPAAEASGATDAPVVVVPPPPPYGGWRVSGVVDVGGVQAEVLLVSVDGTGGLMLRPGDRFHGLTCAGVSGEWALFDEAGVPERVAVAVGHTLDQRAVRPRGG